MLESVLLRLVQSLTQQLDGIFS